MKKLIARKYYWPMLRTNIESYDKGCDVCLVFKSVKYKPYDDFQSSLVPIYQWKDLFMAFATRLPVSTNWKRETYDSILVIVNWLTKMVYYKLVKVTINVVALAEVIINTVVWHYSLLDSIVSDLGSVFIQSFGLCSVTSQGLRGNNLLLFTHRPMAKQRDRIAL